MTTSGDLAKVPAGASGIVWRQPDSSARAVDERSNGRSHKELETLKAAFNRCELTLREWQTKQIAFRKS